MRTVAYYRANHLRFLRDGSTTRNIAYTLQLTDLNQWLLNRFDLDFSVLSLLCKQSCVTLVSVIEAVLYADWAQRTQSRGKRPRLVDLIDDARVAGRIGVTTAEALHAARHLRNNVHLSNVTASELDRYGRSDYNQIVIAERGLLKDLNRDVSS